MLEGKAVVGETMQQYALDLTSKALDCFDITDATDIARFIKKTYTQQELDGAHGIGWQCIVGTDFSSFVTHRNGCFIYFSIGSLAILLFKGFSVLVTDEETEQFLTLEPVEA